MRNFILGFLVASLVFGTVAIANEFRVERAGFDILVNGEEFKSDPPPVVIDGRTFLPLRAMGDALNTRVHWNGEERRVEVGKMPQALTDVIVSDGLQIKPIGRKELDGHYTVVVEVTNIADEGVVFEWQRLGMTVQHALPVWVENDIGLVKRDTLIEVGDTNQFVLAYKTHGGDFIATASLSYKGVRTALNYRTLPII